MENKNSKAFSLTFKVFFSNMVRVIHQKKRLLSLMTMQTFVSQNIVKWGCYGQKTFENWQKS